MKTSVSDRHKLEACLTAMKRLINDEKVVDPKAISVLLRQKIGPGWTIVTAAQWLTGKAAWAAVEAMEPDAVSDVFSKAQAMSCIVFAAEFCRQLDASGGTDLAIERLKQAIKDGGLK